MGNILLSATTTNILNGLDSAAKEGETLFWIIASKYVSPCILFILLLALLFQLLKTGLSWDKMHNQWEANSMNMITLIVIMGIVGSFWFWGAKMLGKNATAPTACLIETENEIVWTHSEIL